MGSGRAAHKRGRCAKAAAGGGGRRLRVASAREVRAVYEEGVGLGSWAWPFGGACEYLIRAAYPGGSCRPLRNGCGRVDGRGNGVDFRVRSWRGDLNLRSLAVTSIYAGFGHFRPHVRYVTDFLLPRGPQV